MSNTPKSWRIEGGAFDQFTPEGKLRATNAALVAALAEIVELFDKHDDCNDIESTTAARQRARAALALAKG